MNNRTFFATLRDLLADLYSDETSARRVAADAGLEVQRIAFSSRSIDTWQAVLTEATNSQRVDALFAVLIHEYGSNNDLCELCQAFSDIVAHGGDPLVVEGVPEPGESPFKGLQFFDVGDADIFFGREHLIAELVEHLRQHHFLAVVGASGSGKSSVVRAGVVATLQRAAVNANNALLAVSAERCPAYMMTPTAHPLESLATILTPTAAPLKATIELMASLAANPRTLHLSARRILSQEIVGTEVMIVHPFDGNSSNKGRRLLLVVDQFEELFTLCHDQAERKAFVDNLLAAADDGVTTVVITLRADFYAHCAEFDTLREYLERYQRYIGPMQTDELRRAIEEPAHRHGWDFEPKLVDLLLADVGKEPGALPLLSHALLATWQRRMGRTMPVAGYIASGRVQGAIGKTADRVFAGLSEKEHDIARGIFLRLTEPGKDAPDTRQRVKRHELIPQTGDEAVTERVLQILADARLLTLFQDDAEIAHEALIREWPQLRGWLDDNREAVRIQHRLTDTAQEWERLQRDPGVLYRGLYLEQALTWAQEHVGELNAAEADFLDASRAEVKRVADEKEAAQIATYKAKYRTWVAISLGIALLAALAAVVIAVRSYHAERVARQQADQARNAAQALKVAAEALTVRTTSPQLGLLLAVETSRFHAPDTQRPMPAAVDTLRSQFDQWTYWQNTLLTHTKAVRVVRFGRGEEELFSAALDGRLLVWHIDRQHADFDQMLALDQAIDAIAVHPGQAWIAVGVQSGEVRVLSLQAGFPQLAAWQAHEANARVLTLMVSPDGQTLISGGADGKIKVWPANPLSQIARTEISIPNQDECQPVSACWVRSLATSPDGHWLAAGAQNQRFYLWWLHSDGLPELVLNEAHLANLGAVAISYDGEWLAAGDETGSFHIYRLDDRGKTAQKATDSYQMRLPPISDVRALAFSTGANLLAIGDGTGIVGTLSLDDDLNSLHILGRLDDAVESIAFSPSGVTIATGGADHSVRLWHTEPRTQEPKVLRGHTGPVRALNFAPVLQSADQPSERLTLVSTGEDETARLWTLDGEIAVSHIITETGNRILAATVSPDGQWLATGGRDGRVRLYARRQLGIEPLILVEHAGAEIVTVAFSPDSRLLATGASDRRIYLWHIENPAQPPQILDNGQGGVLTVAFSPDGQWLAVGDEARRVKLWDLHQSPPSVRTLFTHEDWVWAIAFSPDGRHLASVSADSMLRLTPLQDDVDAQGPILTHARRGRAVAYAPSGNLLATAGDDATVKLWDPQDLGEEPVVLSQHTGVVRALAFSPDGALLASAGDDHEIRIWTVGLADLQRMACARTARNLSQEEWIRFFPGQPYRVTCPNLEK